MSLPFARRIDSNQVALLMSIAAMLLGVTVLAGWAFDISALKSVAPGLVTMKPNTAVGMLLCGLALALFARGGAGSRPRAAVWAMAAAVIAVAALSIVEDLFRWDTGIDHLLFPDASDTVDSISHGRMSPTTALCFLLVGGGLFAAVRPGAMQLHAPVLYGLAASVLTIGGLGLLGHASAALAGTRWWNYAGMAMHTTLGFVLLGSGLVASLRARSPLAWSLSTSGTLGFALGIAVLMAATTASYSLINQSREEAAWVTHTEEALKEAGQVARHIAALESSQRGYIITGDAALLDHRPATTAELDAHLAALRGLIADNPYQQERLDRLAPLLRERLEFADRTIATRRDLGFEPARALIAAGTGIRLTDRINQLVRAMTDEEYALLERRRALADASATANVLLLPLGVFLSITIVLVELFVLNAGAGRRQRAESALDATEAKYRRFIEQASDGIFVIDQAGRFLYVNPRACDLLGYAAGELAGVDHAVTYPEADRHVISGRFARVKAGELLRYERTVRRRDGSTFPAEFSSRMLDSGELQVIFHDISERRRAESQLRESEAKFRQLIEQASDGIFISDAEGKFVLVNSRGCELLGYQAGEMIGLNGGMTYLDDEREIHARRMQEVQAGAALRFERMVRRKDGTAFPAEISVKKLDNGLVLVIFHDISVRRQQEERIARLHRIQAVLSGINSAIVRIRDRDELFAEACRIATEAGAFRVALIGLAGPDSRLVPVARGGAGAALLDAIQPGSGGTLSGVAARAFKEGSTAVENDITKDPDIDPIRREAIAQGCRSAIALPLLREDKRVGIILLYSTEKNAFDDEEIKLLEELAGDVSFALTFIAQQEKVNYLAYYDILTGLPNRSLFFDRLGQQLAAAGRDRSTVALVLLDIDRFRMVNETMGRHAGDTLLKAIADRVKAALRDQDTIARISADGFAIAVSGWWRTQDLARVIEARNRELFGTPFWIEGEELRVSATAGVAVFPDDASDSETLAANAEAALRSAKQQSAPLLFYGREMNAQAAESLRLENRLRKAMEKQELALCYQPKIDVRTGRFTGFEALMRWTDPDSGPVSPVQFIPIMEKTGLILEAGAWALQQVARDCAAWMKDARTPPRVAVNVSPLQLRARNFVDTVVDAAKKIEAAGGSLDLEITESVIMDNVDAVISKLQTIRSLGVRIYVDDFGTGYSSLAYIARLPIYALKIDRSFVVGMTQSEESLSIVQSVISLAHALKLRVVAEGVETEAQAELLKRLACDELQGYLFGKPASPPEVPGLLGKFA